jgi:hypothetical protein
VSWKQAAMLRRGSVGQFGVVGVGVAKLADDARAQVGEQEVVLADHVDVLADER